jgi:hypothetical protein
LNPGGVKSFKDFADEKLPTNGYEQCLVASYYLIDVLDIKNVTHNHVYTCFKQVNWKTPPYMYDKLITTAHEKGWLDTSDLMNVKLTPHGSNYVEYDLPKKKDKKE